MKTLLLPILYGSYSCFALSDVLLGGEMHNLFSRGVIFYNFHHIVGSPRWLAIFKLNQISYVTSLSTGDYYSELVMKFKKKLQFSTD